MQTWKEKLVSSDWKTTMPAKLELILDLEANVGCKIPRELKEFLSWSNGGEGYVNGEFLRLFSCEEIVKQNNDYKVGEFLSGYILIGNDGGDCFYFVKDDVANDSSVLMLLSGAFFEDEIEVLGKTFSDFLCRRGLD